MMTRSNRIWEFQSIVDSPKLAPIHIWIKLVSMCGTLFGICTIIFLGVENDTLSCLDLLQAAGNMGLCFHLLSFHLCFGCRESSLCFNI